MITELKKHLMGLLLCSIGLVQAAVGPSTSLHIVDLDGQALANAVVILDAPGLGAPIEPVSGQIIDQKNFRFVPQVLAVAKGSAVRFPNSDKSLHQVYSFSPVKSFNLALYGGNQVPKVRFDRTGLVVLGCNIHDSMIGYVYIVDSGLFAVSDTQGYAALPAYDAAQASQLTVWHPQLEQDIQLSLAEFNALLATGSDLVLPMHLEAPMAPASDLRSRLQGNASYDY